MKIKVFYLDRLGRVFLPLLFLLGIACNGRIFDGNSGEGLLPLEGKLFFYFTPAVNYMGASESGQLSFFNLLIRTEKFYPSSGFSIVSTLINMQNGHSLVSIKGIEAPDGITLPVFSPATAGYTLDFTGPSIILDFVYRSMLDRYMISLIDSTIVVDTITSSFTAYSPLN